jgi:hypothetical protein
LEVSYRVLRRCKDVDSAGATRWVDGRRRAPPIEGAGCSVPEHLPGGALRALGHHEHFHAATWSKERSKFAAEIERYRKSIDKTVDLFSRIKDTQQAEEVLTVLFASRQVKKGDKNADVEEQEIYNYILEWKKTWNAPAKREAVAEAVRNLTLLGWIRVRPSSSMMEFA